MSDLDKIFDINKKLQSFDLISQTVIALKENEEDILNLVKDQMLSGQDSAGSTRDYRSLAYAEMKRDMPSYSAPYPRTNWYLTGELHDKMKIQISGSSWNIISDAGHFAEIKQFEGEELFIPNEERKDIARSIIQEDLTNQIKSLFE